MFVFNFELKMCMQLAHVIYIHTMYVTGFTTTNKKKDKNKKSLLRERSLFTEYAEDMREKFPEWNASRVE